MKQVRMLKTMGGAREGDVVGFENHAEADAHVEKGEAVEVRFDANLKKHVPTRFDQDQGLFVDQQWDDDAKRYVDIEAEAKE